jgi:4,5-DOPA dioxygenase extradiol
VHNVPRVDWSYGARGFDRSERFDAHVRSVMMSDPAALATVEQHPDYQLAVPTTEHFLPLAHLAGLCSATGEAAQPFAEGRTLGSLSMTSYLPGDAAAGGGRARG